MIGEHSGRFWLAGVEDRVVPGRLILATGSHPRIELDEPLTSPIQEIVEEKSANGVARKSLVVADESHIVHGVISIAAPSQPVTLVDAFTSNSGRGGQTLQARYALVGGHVADRAERFTRLRLRLRHLDAWARPPGFTSKPEDDPPVPLTYGGQLALDKDDSVSMPNLVGGRLERIVWLRAFDMRPSTYDELEQNILAPLASLLTLAANSGCPPVEVEVASAPEQTWLWVHNKGIQRPADVLRSAYHTLLPRPDLDLEHIATWLGLVKKLNPLPSVVADVTGRHGGTLQTQLLELTTVAEGLHKRIFGGQMYYVSRLQELAEYVEPSVPGVTGQTDEWKDRVKTIRNRFAHQGDQTFLDQATVDEYLAVLLSLRWLLTGLLLLQAGIPPETIANRINQHQPYQRFRRQAHHWLPHVYRSLG